MKKDLVRVATRIHTELIDLEQVVSRCERALAKSKTTSDDLYFDSIALNLEGFYSGLERLLRLIAATIDGQVPQGSEWHKELFDQMCYDVPGVRPAVFSENARSMLDEYRLRHVVRVVYTFTLEPQRLEELTLALRPAYTIARRELEAFAVLLEQRAKEK